MGTYSALEQDKVYGVAGLHPTLIKRHLSQLTQRPRFPDEVGQSADPDNTQHSNVTEEVEVLM